MLLFIIEPLLRMCMYMYFNTSHVTVYLRNNMCSRIKNSDFNTSHVTVYHEDLDGTIALYQFQYISCYCLSFSRIPSIISCPLFQYISCYCLSKWSGWSAPTSCISIHLMLLFIPWHSGYLRTLDGISIHLMLLFIGRICRGSVANIYFNTSHVTVYPGTMQPRTIL